MPRQNAVQVDNNFSNGLITEATGLNFPQNAVTETYDCEFNEDGSVKRRLGFDFENGYTTKTISRTDNVVNSYLWRNVAGDGDVTLLVVQIGSTLYFYRTTGDIFSTGAVATTVSLTPVSGAPAGTSTTEAQFSDGNGFLFVTHPYCEPMRISYNTSTDVATATNITLKIRDFQGVDDTLTFDQRPVTLTGSHRYNLANQGWTSSYVLTSTTSITIGTGSKTFTVNINSANNAALKVGDRVGVSDAAAPNTNFMNGICTAYSGTSFTVNVTAVGGAGTISNWLIFAAPEQILAWNTDISNYPSNADVWWRFKNSSGVFAPATTVSQISLPNAPAPKGHYVLDAFNADRSLASGISGLSVVTSSGQRPSTSAFFAGRLFYAAVNSSGFNSNIYFSQVVERNEQYAFCYQENDPTSEDLFDILPTDGGVISIPEAGTIYKLMTVPGGLAVFAANGVWFLAGSTGIGFTANDYTVQKISEVTTISATSFVSIRGFPAWWTSDGIYVMEASSSSNLPVVQNITNNKIKKFYDAIDVDAKKFARGIYHPNTNHVRWLYRSAGTLQVTNIYEFDRVLNFNIVTGAFYPWTIASSNVKVNGFMISNLSSGAIFTDNVTANGGVDLVIDGSGNQVISFESSGLRVSAFDKYLVSYSDSGSHKFTFADRLNADFLDWVKYDNVGVNYTSYFITGFKLPGSALRKFSSNWVRVFSRIVDQARSFNFQGIWDFAKVSTGTNRWSAAQLVRHEDLNYSSAQRRLKVRGHGVALQFKVTSVDGEPFDIIGWGNDLLINQAP